MIPDKKCARRPAAPNGTKKTVGLERGYTTKARRRLWTNQGRKLPIYLVGINGKTVVDIQVSPRHDVSYLGRASAGEDRRCAEAPIRLLICQEKSSPYFPYLLEDVFVSLGDVLWGYAGFPAWFTT